MKCIDATRRLSEAMDRELSLGEALRLKGHLLLCDACTQYRQQLAVLRVAAKRMGQGQIPTQAPGPANVDASANAKPTGTDDAA